MKKRLFSVILGTALSLASAQSRGHAEDAGTHLDFPGSKRSPAKSLADIPVGAQPAISATLGRADRSYHPVRVPAGLRADNHRHGIRVDFSRREVTVATGEDRFAMSLRAVGYGNALGPVTSTSPTAKDNRVEYRRGTLTEWYVNGPLGLEQGFTLEQPPARRAPGPLTLALSVAGTFDAAPEPGKKGLSLGRRGNPTLAYSGLTAVDASGRDLPARIELADSTMLLRIDDADARYPVVIDPFITKATLLPSEEKDWEAFGYCVALSGDTIVVGAYNPSPARQVLPGAAYVFVKPASGWLGTLTETARLTSSESFYTSDFGTAVAIAGDTVLVGNPTLNSGPGAVHVFVKPPGGWAGTLTENAMLTASDGSDNDDFGDVFGNPAISASGETVVVGLPHDEIAGNSQQGSAYVFVRPAGGWAGTLTENSKLTASDGAEFDRFGWDVNISGDTVVAGAYRDSTFKVIVTPTGTEIVPVLQVGSVYVFQKPATGWEGTLTESAKLIVSDAEEGDHLGETVSVRGDTVFAGAPGGFDDSVGKAYVFVEPASGWSGVQFESARLAPSDPSQGDHFGGGLLAVSEDEVVVPKNSVLYRFAQPAGGWSGQLTETEILWSHVVPLWQPFDYDGKTLVKGDSDSAVVLELPYMIAFLDLEWLLAQIFRSGSTIPLRFQLGEGNGSPISDAEAENLASTCSVQVFFSGGSRSPGCARYDGGAFQFSVTTAERLPSGTYAITVEVSLLGDVVSSQTVDVRIRRGE